MEFFKVIAVSELLYGCTTWIQSKQSKKKLEGNYTRMLRVVLNKSETKAFIQPITSRLTAIMK